MFIRSGINPIRIGVGHHLDHAAVDHSDRFLSGASLSKHPRLVQSEEYERFR